MATTDLLGRLDAPDGRPTTEIDVRQSPPPEPLSRTLERLTELDDEATATESTPVLLQRNDRVPRHLFPKLDDRGYEYDHAAVDDHVVTAIWRP